MCGHTRSSENGTWIGTTTPARIGDMVAARENTTRKT